MNKIFKLALFALTCISFYSCKESNKQDDQPLVVSESKKVDSLFTCFNIKINESDTLIINDSVKLYYSNKTFLATNQATTETQIKIRCIYNASDAYQLNIPLSYDSSGVIKILKTGGMYEIRTEQDVKINDKFPATLVLNKQNISNDYRLYTFNDNLNTWNYKSSLTFFDNSDVNPLNLIPLRLNPSMVKLEINLKEHIQGSLLTNIPEIHWVYAGPEGDVLMDPAVNEDFSRSKFTDFDVTPSTSKKGCLDLVLTTNGKLKLKTIVAAAFDKNYYETAMSLLKNYNNKKTVIIEINAPGLVNIDKCLQELNTMAKLTDQDYRKLFVSFKLAKENQIILEDVQNINFFTPDNKSYFKLGNIPSEIYKHKNDSSISVPKNITEEFKVILTVDDKNFKWINSTVDFDRIFEMNQIGRSPLIKLQRKEEHDWVQAFSN